MTARDFAQTLQLLDRFAIEHTAIGRHRGERLADKAIGLASRSTALVRSAHRESRHSTSVRPSAPGTGGARAALAAPAGTDASLLVTGLPPATASPGRGMPKPGRQDALPAQMAPQADLMVRPGQEIVNTYEHIGDKKRAVRKVVPLPRRRQQRPFRSPRQCPSPGRIHTDTSPGSRAVWITPVRSAPGPRRGLPRPGGGPRTSPPGARRCSGPG